MSTFLDFLNKAIAKAAELGPKFPALLIIIMQVAEKIQEGIELVFGPQPRNATFEPTAAEKAAEAKLIEILRSAPRAGPELEKIGDGAILRWIWQMAQKYPQLLQVILLLFNPTV